MKPLGWKIWHSHHSFAQKYYDLEKINVEWSAQNNYYDLEKINVDKVLVQKKRTRKNKCRVEMFTNKNVVVSSRPELLWPRKYKWSAPSPPWSPKLLRPRKNKCRVVLPSHHQDAQNNYYDLVKINVEWSGPLTTILPKNNTTSKK
jgi:hypothetical protein